MNFSTNLPDKVIVSIHNFCSSQINYHINNKYSLNQLSNQSLYCIWYVEWITQVYSLNTSIWKVIKKQKNNISFVNLVFEQFEKEIEHHTPSTNLSKQESSAKPDRYYQYANELYIEAHGKELTLKNYKKPELLSIIKDCERLIRFNLLNQTEPTHNIVFLH